MTDFSYVGKELDIFAHAKRWKSYWAAKIQPYLGSKVLEVGAGIGSNTEILCSANQERWVCLEPDERLLQVLDKKLGRFPYRNSVETRAGTIRAVATTEQFDSVVYVDVLEHIENDQAELELAAPLLSVGGALVVLAPAHQWLFSPFDRAIGHFRRYTRKTLAAIGPSGLVLERTFYLDSVGLLASSGNRLFLRQGMPTLQQIEFWDRWLIPVSRKLDPCLAYVAGKTVVGIWRRYEDPAPRIDVK